MKINTTNIKSFLDTQRAFDNIKTELNNYVKDKEIYIPDYGLWSFIGNSTAADTRSITTGSKVPNDYELFEPNGISTNLDFTFNINANKIYKLQSEILFGGSTANCTAMFQWYDEEKNIYIGGFGYCLGQEYVTNTATAPTSFAYIKTKREQKVSLRLKQAGSIQYLFGDNPAHTLSYSWISIQEIARI